MTGFPDLSLIQTELARILSPLGETVDLRIQFPQTEFDIASNQPNITVSIKDISIYDKYLAIEGETDAAFPIEVTLAVGIYVPKSQDSSRCYRLFSEVSELLMREDVFRPSKISCSELEYVPDLRHYRLRATAVMKKADICKKEETDDGGTDI